MKCIAYKDGYKYQLKADYVIQGPIVPPRAIDAEYLALTLGGVLTVKKGYAWDGPSGPTVDTRNFMRGSLVHDACYQLIREGYISAVKYRDVADRWLQAICIEDGMSVLRAWWVYQGVHWGGQPAVDPASLKPILKAPEGCQDP